MCLERHICQMITQVYKGDANAFILLWTKKEKSLIISIFITSAVRAASICVRGVVLKTRTR